MSANDCPLCHGRGATYADVPVVATVAQAAEILELSERFTRSLIASGRLGHCRLGRAIRIPRHEIISLILANDDDADSERADAAETDQPPTPEGSRHGRG